MRSAPDMPTSHLTTIALLALLLAAACGDGPADPSFSGEIRIPMRGEVPSGMETHFFLPFDVPEGVAEIEVRHSDLSSENILDWGLDDPNGFRGWGGGARGLDLLLLPVRFTTPSSRWPSPAASWP